MHSRLSRPGVYHFTDAEKQKKERASGAARLSDFDSQLPERPQGYFTVNISPHFVVYAGDIHCCLWCQVVS